MLRTFAVWTITSCNSKHQLYYQAGYSKGYRTERITDQIKMPESHSSLYQLKTHSTKQEERWNKLTRY